jgi:hypothetical protein
MSSIWGNDESWLDDYNQQIEKQERDRIVKFLNSLVKDLEMFNDNAEDIKAIVTVLESEDWALGY